MHFPAVSVRARLPALVVLGTAGLVLVLDLLPPRARKGHLPVLSLAGIVLALLSTTWLWGEETRAFHGMIVLDGYALFLQLVPVEHDHAVEGDRKSTRLNSSHGYISYAVVCLKKKK